MRLPAELFWRLTPREFSALSEQWTMAEKTLDRRAALMPWIFAEAHRDERKKSVPFAIEDFMPGGKPATPNRMTPAQIRTVVRMAFEDPRWKASMVPMSGVENG